MKLRILSWIIWLGILAGASLYSADLAFGVIAGAVLGVFIFWAHGDHRIVKGEEAIYVSIGYRPKKWHMEGDRIVVVESEILQASTVSSPPNPRPIPKPRPKVAP